MELLGLISSLARQLLWMREIWGHRLPEFSVECIALDHRNFPRHYLEPLNFLSQCLIQSCKNHQKFLYVNKEISSNQEA